MQTEHSRSNLLVVVNNLASLIETVHTTALLECLRGLGPLGALKNQ